MPDHLHLAISIEEDSGALSNVLQGFKSYTTRTGWQHGYRGALWQRSYSFLRDLLALPGEADG